MPNWCENDLTVTIGKAGSDAELRAFLDAGIDFNTAIEYPAEYRAQDRVAEEWCEQHNADANADWSKAPKDGFNSGGYQWCVDTWGTKSNIDDKSKVPTSVESKKLTYSFSTPWSPPLLVIAAWSAKYPGLKFKLEYYEGGCGFQGKLVVVGGEVIEDIRGSYHGSRGG